MFFSRKLHKSSKTKVSFENTKNKSKLIQLPKKKMKVLLFATSVLLLLLATALCSAKIIKLNPKNFDKIVYRTDKKTLVNFFAPWDGHSQRLAKSYKELSESDYVLKEHPELDLAQIDVTKYPEIAEAHKVDHWPTLVLFKDGRKKGREYTGRKQYQDLINFLNTFLDYDEEKAEREKLEREEEQRQREAERLRKEQEEANAEKEVQEVINEELDEK